MEHRSFTKIEHEYHNLGNDYYKIGEFDKSVEHYTKALDIDPKLLETYFNRGLAYTRKQQYDLAIKDFNKVIELNPNLAEAFYTRGLVYEYKNNYEQAIADYEKALRIDPNYERAREQLSIAHGKKAGMGGGGGGGRSSGGGGGAVTADGGEDYGLTEFEILKKPNMNFGDIAGLEKTKEEIIDAIVYPLKYPELSKKYGKQAGGGIILYGPPGCGKTYIGKATAGEADASFINVKISDIVDMYAGNTEKNIHNAFDTARKNKPTILFLDELDGMGGRRDKMQQSFEKRSINQFLTEMDGVEYSNEGVLIMGATNAPWDLDPALRRPGRFSKLIYFPQPDKRGRRDILLLNLKNRPVSLRLNLWRIARATEGYSGADLKELCNAAAAVPWKEAIKTGKERVITFKDFREAMKKVRPSLPAWYSSVKKYLIEEEEEEEEEKKASSEEGGGTMVVKHKKEQEELLGEEERMLFNDLISDIKKYNSTWYKTFRKTRTTFAKYGM